jgi:hypothetical protein
MDCSPVSHDVAASVKFPISRLVVDPERFESDEQTRSAGREVAVGNSGPFEDVDLLAQREQLSCSQRDLMQVRSAERRARRVDVIHAQRTRNRR